jgi:DNA processing protein
MTHPSEDAEFVALSLLPVSVRCSVGECLRAGDAPRRILEKHLERCWSTRPDELTKLMPRAIAALERARRKGIRWITWIDEAYPPGLAATADPPAVVWSVGGADRLVDPAVAIVGARAASSYGLAVAERLAAELAARGVTIVSGLARGIDSAAHRGALSAQGVTVAVLGSGVDVIYPPEHAALAADIGAAGAILSELVPGTPPHGVFFPLRNRIISGLSRAVVVVEAGERSGSLITARLALDQGREVLAVPGNVLNGRNRGGHALLRDGAKIVESADDILEELRLPVPGRGGVRAGPGAGAGRGAAERDPVLAGLPAGETCDLDVIASRTGLRPERLLPRLLDLELQGLVRRAGGGRFVRI